MRAARVARGLFQLRSYLDIVPAVFLWHGGLFNLF